MGNLIRSWLSQQNNQSTRIQLQKFDPIVLSERELLKSLKYMILINNYHYTLNNQLHHHLVNILTYFSYEHPKYDNVEQLISKSNKQFCGSSIFILHKYCKSIGLVAPINSTYFYFLRKYQLQFYYVMCTYILEMVKKKFHKSSNLFQCLPTSQLTKRYKCILNWAYSLIEYKCSAIYIQIQSTESFIFNNYLLLCAIITNNQLVLIQQENQLLQRFLYISLYILCKQISASKSEINVNLIALASISKVLSSINNIEYTVFVPSYWYLNIIGYVQRPYVSQILLLICLKLLQNWINVNNKALQLITVLSLIKKTLRKCRAINGFFLLNSIMNFLKSQPPQSLFRPFLIDIIQEYQFCDYVIESYNEQKQIPYKNGEIILNKKKIIKIWDNLEVKMSISYFESGLNNKEIILSQEVICNGLHILSREQSECIEIGQQIKEDQEKKD